MKQRESLPYDPSQVQEDVKAIYQMGFFDDVRAELVQKGATWILIYAVKERPSIKEVRIQGTSAVDQKKFDAALGIKAQAILDRERVRLGVERAKKLYDEKGYLDAKIETDVLPEENNQVTLQIRVQEGKRLLVKRIRFEGNKVLDEKRLKKVMRTREKNLLSLVTSAGVLDEDALTNDLALLSSQYLDLGYINAKIDEPQIRRESDGVVVTIRIEEGAQFKVGKLDFTGDVGGHDQQKLFSLVAMKPGEVFSGSKLRQSISQVTDLFTDEGYAFVRVDPKTELNPEEKQVNVKFAVDPGEKVHFGRIIISGNSKTRDKVIRREIAVQEQETFSRSKLRDSRELLGRLGFFEDVNLNTRKGEKPDEVDLLVDVKEGNTGSFSTGAGFSSIDKFIFNFRVTENNLFGKGQSIVFNGDVGTVRQNFEISLTEPYWNDRPLSVGLDAFNSRREFTDFTEGSRGGGTRLSYPLKELGITKLEQVRGGVEYRLSDEIISHVNDGASIVIQDEKGSSLISALIPNVSRDTRNSLNDPTEGSLQSFSFKFAGLGGQERFLKPEVRGRWYFPVYTHPRFGTLTFSTGGFVGYGVGLKERRTGDTNLPLFERYFPGGIDTVRGFKTRTLGPKARVFGAEGDPTTDEIGGDKEVVFNNELIFPIFEKMGLKGLFFFDAGQAYGKNKDFYLAGTKGDKACPISLLNANPDCKLDETDVTGLRLATGAGIRWLSPFGPVRAGLGFPMNKKPGDKSSVFLFSLGAQP